MEDQQAGNVWPVELAQVATSPFSPNKRLNILLSLVVGLGLGIGLAFFFEYLDNSVKNGAELERHAGVPALGLIPTLRRRGAGKVVALDSHGQAVDIELITHQLPKSNHAEAYRDLRTTLLLSSPDHPPKLLMVTSAQPREGKTSTALNIAISLTQIGRKVLILDADLRRPRVHKALGLNRERGLSTCLAGSTGWTDLLTGTSVPGLWALTSGPIPPNPAELLASQSFKALLQALRTGDRFDHVVIDSPPVLAVADPVIVGEQCDGVLVVVHGGLTARQNVVTAVDKLRAGSVRILGAVLNNMDLNQQGYYQYRYNYRGSYYTQTPGDQIAADDGVTTPGKRTGEQA
jgi:capsular exopolysaccharide synthesis family protein